MCDFDRFDKVFGPYKSNKKQTPNRRNKKAQQRHAKSSKRNFKEVDMSDSMLDLTVMKKGKIQASPFYRTPEVAQKRKSRLKVIEFCSSSEPEEIESPDKQEVLHHISCSIDDFKETPKKPEANFDDSENEIKIEQEHSIRPEVIERLKQEIFSPDIEEFSESDDIFHMSQEGMNIHDINQSIIGIYSKKPKYYRPINKVPKPGGLMERLRELKNRRFVAGCNYAAGTIAEENQRKIQITDSCAFRRRLLISFKFADEFIPPNPDKAEIHHFMAVPQEFKRLIELHSHYDVVFDLPEQEFMPSHFMHFGKMIKAGRQY